VPLDAALDLIAPCSGQLAACSWHAIIATWPATSKQKDLPHSEAVFLCVEWWRRRESNPSQAA